MFFEQLLHVLNGALLGLRAVFKQGVNPCEGAANDCERRAHINVEALAGLGIDERHAAVEGEGASADLGDSLGDLFTLHGCSPFRRIVSA